MGYQRMMRAQGYFAVMSAVITVVSLVFYKIYPLPVVATIAGMATASVLLAWGALALVRKLRFPEKLVSIFLIITGVLGAIAAPVGLVGNQVALHYAPASIDVDAYGLIMMIAWLIAPPGIAWVAALLIQAVKQPPE
jgi:hypothetical protein